MSSANESSPILYTIRAQRLMMLVYFLTVAALAAVTTLTRRMHLTDQIDLFETTNAPFELLYAVDTWRLKSFKIIRLKKL